MPAPAREETTGHQNQAQPPAPSHTHRPPGRPRGGPKPGGSLFLLLSFLLLFSLFLLLRPLPRGGTDWLFSIFDVAGRPLPRRAQPLHPLLARGPPLAAVPGSSTHQPRQPRARPSLRRTVRPPRWRVCLTPSPRVSEPWVPHPPAGSGTVPTEGRAQLAEDAPQLAIEPPLPALARPRPGLRREPQRGPGAGGGSRGHPPYPSCQGVGRAGPRSACLSTSGDSVLICSVGRASAGNDTPASEAP